MSPTSEFMAEVSLAHSCPELFRVTGPLPSLVLRTEDMWQRYTQCLEVGRALNQGSPFSPLKKETYDGPAWRLMFTCGVRDQFTTTSTSTSHLLHDRPASVIKSHARRSDSTARRDRAIASRKRWDEPGL
jgi:hypothetical protein